MKLRIYAENFRGFRKLDFAVDEVMFLVGDNSSGKTSIMYLIDFVLSTELSGSAYLKTPGVGSYDYFSPYFNFDDVIVGYSYGDGDKAQYKVVTIKKNRSDTASITHVTISRAGFAFTSRRRGSKIEYRLISISGLSGIQDIVNLHKKSTGFKIHADLDDDDVKHLNSEDSVVRVAMPLITNSELRDSALKTIAIGSLPSSRFIAALRAEPALYYSKDRRYQKRGEHFAAMAHDLISLPSDGEQEESRNILVNFGREGGLFEDIRFTSDKRRRVGAPIFVDVFRGGQVLALSQLGFGLSQVLPVIMEMIFAKYHGGRYVISVQQPELHLHPRAQAAFGEVFHRIASDNVNVVVETHSDFIIDRYRDSLRNGEAKIKSSIVFCQRTNDGNEAIKIEIDERGALVDPPSQYREFFLSELARTL